MATPLSAIFSSYMNSKMKTLSIFLLMVLLICIIGVIYFVIMKYVYKKKMNVPNSDSNGGDITIMIFTVNWCPHCKKAATPWADFKQAYEGKKIKGRIIHCNEYDLTDDNETNSSIAKKYNVDSYPTIKMLKDGQMIDFDAKVTTYALERFVEDMI